MRRIIWHWTAGGHSANSVDREAYHFVIEGHGAVVEGNYAPSANLDIRSGRYAKHTRGLNTGSIGIALAGMRGSRERPFAAGPSPITERQVDELVELTAALCRKHGIPVTRQTVLSHAEVEATLGVKQRPRWDISWLPGMPQAGDPLFVGDELRRRVQARLMWAPAPAAPVEKPSAPSVARPGASAGSGPKASQPRSVKLPSALSSALSSLRRKWGW